MVTEKKTFLSSILTALDRELTALSFRKSADVYLKELGKDTQGWAGINVSTHLPHNRVGLSPSVGVNLFADRGPWQGTFGPIIPQWAHTLYISWIPNPGKEVFGVGIRA